MNPLESVAIRRGGPADEDALREIIRSAGRGEAHRIDVLPVLLSDADHFVYLAETARPFGFVGAGRGTGEVVGDDVGEIMGLFLDPAFQGHGMGKKLLVRGLSVLKRRGFARVLAWVPDESERAAPTFEAVGFAPLSGLVREVNTASGSVAERGLLLDLDAFF